MTDRTRKTSKTKQRPRRPGAAISKTLLRRLAAQFTPKAEPPASKADEPGTFAGDVGTKFREALEHLSASDPAAAGATFLRLFLGLSWQEIGFVLGAPHGTPLSGWRRAEASFRQQVQRAGTPVAVYNMPYAQGTKAPSYHERHAYATLARHPIDGTLVASAAGPAPKNDDTLARIITRVLAKNARQYSILQERLRGYSCLFSVEFFNEEAAEQDVRRLLRQIASHAHAGSGFNFRSRTAGVVGLTLIDVRDIQKRVQREGLGPREKKQDRSAEDAAPQAHLPKAELILEDVDQLLASASPSSPVETLSKILRLLDAIHRQRLPGLQAYLDQVRIDVGKEPGGNFGSFEDNKAFVDVLRAMLQCLNARLECPTCSRAATLIVKLGATKTGSFLFHHATDDLRTDHGGKTSLPPLKVISST